MRSPRARLAALLLTSWAAAGLAQPESPAAEPAPAERQAAADPSAAQAARPQARPVNVFAPSSVAYARRMSVAQREERQFLKNAWAASRFEREAAHLALAKTSSARLREWAMGLEGRQQAWGNELQHLLQQRGMAAPMMANAHRHALRRLARLRGPDFDREFVRQVAVRGQREQVALFERAATSAQDMQIKTWADGKLRLLRDHLAMADDRAGAAFDQRVR